MEDEASVFSHEQRVRVCGLLVQSNSILLAQIHSPVIDQLIWTPPGGGLKFGESMKDCLKREFREETNLDVSVGELLHINELINLPFHAVECYFEVEQQGGEHELGIDPELSDEQQLLRELRWIPVEKLEQVNFVPVSLVQKLKNWSRRYEYPVFKGANPR